MEERGVANADTTDRYRSPAPSVTDNVLMLTECRIAIYSGRKRAVYRKVCKGCGGELWVPLYKKKDFCSLPCNARWRKALPLPASKVCPLCNKDKPLAEYRKNGSRKDGAQSYCMPCEDQQKRGRYRADIVKFRKRNNDRHKLVRAETLRFLIGYFVTHPCVDCGESDPIVLDFDHVRGVKSYNIATMIAGTHAIESIKKEIDKCDVRCANCHRRRTAIYTNWGKVRLLKEIN